MFDIPNDNDNIFVYVIDENGYIVSSRIVDLNQRELEPNEINNTILPSLYKHKWNGTEWIEGATQEEIDELTKVEPSPPTEIEIMEQRLADLELMLTEILTL